MIKPFNWFQQCVLFSLGIHCCWKAIWREIVHEISSINDNTFQGIPRWSALHVHSCLYYMHPAILQAHLSQERSKVKPCRCQNPWFAQLGPLDCSLKNVTSVLSPVRKMRLLLAFCCVYRLTARMIRQQINGSLLDHKRRKFQAWI